MIDAPGIYNIPVFEYEADPCPEPSLRASGIKRLLSESPLDFSAYHPRLTRWPHLLSESTRRQNEGAIAHALILGKGCDFVVMESEDAPVKTEQGKPYRNWSGKALAWKEAEEARGITFISHEKNAAAETAKQAVWDLLSDEYGDYAIGDTEVSVIWRRETAYGPIWCRARLDLLAQRFVTILDPKTTELSISNSSIRKMSENDGWYIQAAWQLEGVEAVMPELAGHLRFRFPVVQVVPPFGCRFYDPPESIISIGRQKNDRAANLFAKCLREGSWPGHPKVASPDPSSWLITQFEEEEMRDV